MWLPAVGIRTAKNQTYPRAASQSELKCWSDRPGLRCLEIHHEREERSPAANPVPLIVPGADAATGRQPPAALAKRVEEKAADTVGASAPTRAPLVPACTACADQAHPQIRAGGNVDPHADVSHVRIRPEVVDARLGPRPWARNSLCTQWWRGGECNQHDGEDNASDSRADHARARQTATA